MTYRDPSGLTPEKETEGERLMIINLEDVDTSLNPASTFYTGQSIQTGHIYIPTGTYTNFNTRFKIKLYQ